MILEMPVEPIGKRVDVFRGSPEITPSMPFSRSYDQVCVLNAYGPRSRDETFRLLQGHNLVLISVNDQCGRQSGGDIIDGRKFSCELVASLRRDRQRSKRHLERR